MLVGANGESLALKEFVTMREINHPNICRAFEYFIIPECGVQCFTMEHCDRLNRFWAFGAHRDARATRIDGPGEYSAAAVPRMFSAHAGRGACA